MRTFFAHNPVSSSVSFALSFAVPLMIATSVVCGVACSDASGSLEGGQAIPLQSLNGDSGMMTSGPTSDAAVCPPSGTPTFSALYACYFTNCGSAGCHGTSADDGALISGFVCGKTASSCAMGMMMTTTSAPPIVPTGGAKDATTTGLYAALDKAGGSVTGASNNMPLVPTFVYQSADLTAIEAWIQGGAPNN